MGKSANGLLRALASLRLAVVLLIIITIAVLAGTLVPQMPAQMRTDVAAYEHWLELTHAKYGGRAELFHAIGLFDIFNTWWFRGLIGALSVNTLACTFRRARRVWRGIKRGAPKSWARWGSLLTHVSLMLLIIGAVVSIEFGWRDEHIIVSESAANQPARWGDGAGLRLTGFTIERYPNGAPRDYRAEIAIMENGDEVARRIIRVNHPFSYRGATFYLVAYGEGYVELLAVHDAGYGIVIGAVAGMVVGMMVTFYAKGTRARQGAKNDNRTCASSK